MECSSFLTWDSTLIFPGATPYSSFRLTQRKFQSLKKILSAHSLSGIFFPLLLPEAVSVYSVGEQISRRGQEVGTQVCSGWFPGDYLQISFSGYTLKLVNHLSSILSERGQ